MSDLATFLQSKPPLEEAAGAILDELVKSRKDTENLGNFVSTITRSPGGDTSNPISRAIFEGFQYLLSNLMIAPTSQAGWYFITNKGREIATGAGLKTYLANEKRRADAAADSVASDLAEMKKRAESEIAKAIKDAKAEAGSILNLARKTAEGVSLKDVQLQFKAAGAECLKRIRVWTTMSIISITAFICILVGFMARWAPPLQGMANDAGRVNAMYPAVIYYAVIRVTLLTAVAAIATFCLKVLRAQMHLREQNLHRERVANSVAAFMGAASAEQRDAILVRMVDAITAFGNSGLLSDNDESMSPARLILESVPRALSQKP